jgi:TonB family protein
VPVILSLRLDAAGTVVDVAPVEGPADLAAIAVTAVRQWRFSATGQESTMLVGFNPAAAGSDMGQPPVLVGGDVRPPVRIKEVKPVYPADAQEAGAQGVVILDTRIAADGSVAEARILRSIPMLDRAAIDAVLKWKFTAAGFPLQMTVTVNFTLQGGPTRARGGVAGGVAGGAASGVAGGVSGGVAGGVGAAPVRVGGNIKAPTKTYDVQPVYPQEAHDAGVQGVVVIEAAIGPEGKVTEAKILRSIPLLDQAALDAVRQWEFAPTILNGVAVPVIMTVTVNFTLQ